jgi:oligoribonuclease NrnB/cAMP/cGMP phosphodiesterase (DHH superfamily)
MPDEQEQWTPDICLYHFPCDDGFAAAWAVRRRWPGCRLVPTNYGQALPDDLALAGRHVLVADFSFKPDALARMVSEAGAASIVILDHHKTAQADLAPFAVERCGGAVFCAADVGGMLRDMAELDRPPVVAYFDMDRSGAALTWAFCFPDEAAPDLIRHVEDRDLWRFALADTMMVSLLLRSLPYEFEAWDRLMHRWQNDPVVVRAEAAGIKRFYDRKIAEMAATATLRTIGGHRGVPVAHAPHAFASDLANALLALHPEAPFAAVAVDAHGGRTWSLRSADGST